MRERRRTAATDSTALGVAGWVRAGLANRAAVGEAGGEGLDEHRLDHELQELLGQGTEELGEALPNVGLWVQEGVE